MHTSVAHPDYKIFHRDDDGAVTSITMRNALSSSADALVAALRAEHPDQSYWSEKVTS